MSTKIAAISGFPEYSPAQQIAFNAIVSKIRTVYESFGYVPLETPAVERIDTLTSKGIDAKEVYALRRLNTEGTDDGSKDLALKFDLTVPLARYVSQHYPTLVFPFRRYQVQPVWRGERAQKGRYRQFYQFDIDYIAENTLPLAADAEILAAAHQALTALGLKFTMRISNRKFLRGILEIHGYANQAAQAAAIKIIDDMEKIPAGEVVEKLSAIQAEDANPHGLHSLLLRWKEKGLQAILTESQEFQQYPTFTEGAAEITVLTTHLAALLGEEEMEASVAVDPTIARGLDYYTGTVMETILHDAPELGSICSGGRYDNLAESLSDRKLPGVGISIGLSRLFAWLSEQPEYLNTPATTAQIFVPLASEADLPTAAEAARALRAAGLAVEQSLTPQPLGAQLQKAEKRGLKYAALPGPSGTLTLRTFATRADEKGLTPAQLAAKLLK